MKLTWAVGRQVSVGHLAKQRKATLAKKKPIVDQLCQVNGWHRDHARHALRLAAAGPPARRRRREPQ